MGGSNFSEEQRYTILQPQFEINPSHPIIKKLAELKTADPQLAVVLTDQLFANAMVSAGLVEDPRTMLNGINTGSSTSTHQHHQQHHQRRQSRPDCLSQIHNCC